jgi:hypothetical protein
MVLTSKITDCDDRWPRMFEVEKARMNHAFAALRWQSTMSGAQRSPALPRSQRSTSW